MKNPTEANVSKYKRVRNDSNARTKNAEIGFYQNIFTEKQNSITSFWKEFSKTLNHKKASGNHRLSKLIIDEMTITEDQDIANALNDYFANVGASTSAKVSQSMVSFATYLKQKVEATFFLSPVTEVEVFNEISHLKCKKSRRS